MIAAVWRAIETRRPMLRVTNTGYTVAVDPLGRIEYLMEPWTIGTAIVRLKRLTDPALGAPAEHAGHGDGRNGRGVVIFWDFSGHFFWAQKTCLNLHSKKTYEI